MFKKIKSERYGTESTVFLPCTAAAEYKRGQALYVTAGGAAAATGETVPTHICVEEKTGVAGEEVKAYRIFDDYSFKTTLSAAGTALKAGDKVTISSDGLEVTATKTNGVAQINKILSSAQGGEVIVSF